MTAAASVPTLTAMSVVPVTTGSSITSENNCSALEIKCNPIASHPIATAAAVLAYDKTAWPKSAAVP